MEKRIGGMWGWLLQRVTGVLLAFGMTVHYLYLHFFTGGNLSFEVVSMRLKSPAWIFFDTFLLAVILYHGFYGLLGIIYDYNPKKNIKIILNYTFLFLGIILFFCGFYALMIFHNPNTPPAIF